MSRTPLFRNNPHKRFVCWKIIASTWWTWPVKRGQVLWRNRALRLTVNVSNQSAVTTTTCSVHFQKCVRYCSQWQHQTSSGAPADTMSVVGKMLPAGPMGPCKQQTWPASIFRCYMTGRNCEITLFSYWISSYMEVKARKFNYKNLLCLRYLKYNFYSSQINLFCKRYVGKRLRWSSG